MRTELKEMQRIAGITFLFVTHDQEEALSLSDCIAVMNNGKVEQVGAPREIYLKPATPFVAGFLGTVNWIDGIGIRPESTRITNGGNSRVVRTIFLGNCVHVVVALPSGGQAIAELPRGTEPFEQGQSVTVTWSPTDELRF
jgi:ABC-type Fe3+/spermidine/putrescine transport system ATPase subunit